ncbi:MAG TPA: DUF6504 family protein [Candidatus Nanopelagicaceae bacterium]|nr:DUF6504 family protein [Candidatus Nanopelagicaceae bacterium]
MSAIEVRAEGTQESPSAVDSGQGFVEVTAVVEHWRIEVGWWRVAPERPVRRDYWRVLLQDDSCLDLRFELASRSWSRERSWG